MPDPNRPLVADLKDELSCMGGELGELARLRWQLARLELNAAARAAKRLAIMLAVAGVMILAALPVLVVWGAGELSRIALTPSGWLLVLGLVLAGVGGLTAWLAWQRFRRQYTGLVESIEEIREDLTWLREWAGRPAEKTGTEELK